MRLLSAWVLWSGVVVDDDRMWRFFLGLSENKRKFRSLIKIIEKLSKIEFFSQKKK